jgi:hypothetical protein
VRCLLVVAGLEVELRRAVSATHLLEDGRGGEEFLALDEDVRGLLQLPRLFVEAAGSQVGAALPLSLRCAVDLALQVALAQHCGEQRIEVHAAADAAALPSAPPQHRQQPAHHQVDDDDADGHESDVVVEDLGDETHARRSGIIAATCRQAKSRRSLT